MRVHTPQRNLEKTLECETKRFSCWRIGVRVRWFRSWIGVVRCWCLLGVSGCRVWWVLSSWCCSKVEHRGVGVSVGSKTKLVFSFNDKDCLGWCPALFEEDVAELKNSLLPCVDPASGRILSGAKKKPSGTKRKQSCAIN